MENNNRYSKYLAIIALVISVIGVSLGFAAYTNTVTIKAKADVVGPTDYDWPGAEPSVDPSNPTPGSVTPKKCTDETYTSCTTAPGTEADPATVTANGIQGIDVHFTEPGQYYLYEFYAVNSSPYTSYLNSVSGIGTDPTYNKTCTPAAVGSVAAASAGVTASVCEHVHISVMPGSDEYIEDDTNITGHTVAANSNEKIQVRVFYDEGYPSDGGIEVQFGDITLTYDSAE